MPPRVRAASDAAKGLPAEHLAFEAIDLPISGRLADQSDRDSTKLNGV